MVGDPDSTLLLSVVSWTKRIRKYNLRTLWKPEGQFQIRTSSKPISPENNQPCNAWSSVSAALSPRRSRLSLHLMAFKWMKYCLLGTVSSRLHFISRDVKIFIVWHRKTFSMTCGLVLRIRLWSTNCRISLMLSPYTLSTGNKKRRRDDTNF